MPIEIRGLLIEVTVLDEAPRPASPAALTGEALRQWQQDLTQTCVRQVLAELQRRRER